MDLSIDLCCLASGWLLLTSACTARASADSAAPSNRQFKACHQRKDGLLPQKCKDAAFCKRLRGQKGDVYAVQTDSVAVEDSKLTARILNEAQNAEFLMTLTAYNGVVRLHIDEDASKGRFQVRLHCWHKPAHILSLSTPWTLCVRHFLV